jgi:hypothetical protein
MPCSYCEKPKVLAKGLCSACYYHLKRHGTLERKRPQSLSPCSVGGCDKVVVANGMCDKHYRRVKQYGSPEATKRPHDWGKRTSHPLYKLWHGMIRRCSDPKHKDYHRYGARGVSVCDRWYDFWLFLDDMGERPSVNHSVDRTDPNGNYEPGNCTWATPAEQARNKRNSVITKELADEIKRRAKKGQSVREIADKVGLSYDHTRSVVVGQSWGD